MVCFGQRFPTLCCAPWINTSFLLSTLASSGLASLEMSNSDDSPPTSIKPSVPSNYLESLHTQYFLRDESTSSHVGTLKPSS